MGGLNRIITKKCELSTDCYKKIIWYSITMSKEGFNQEAWNKLVEEAKRSEGLETESDNTPKNESSFSDIEEELNSDQEAA